MPKIIYKDDKLTIIRELEEDATATEFMQSCIELANNVTYGPEQIEKALTKVIL